MTQTENKIMEILREIKPYDEITTDTDLLKSGILDSLAFVLLITQVEEEFDIEFDENDIDIKEFSSVKKIAKNTEDISNV